MFRTRMFSRLFVVSALGAIACQPLLAGEPAASTPPAKSIREWMAKPSAAPAAQAPVAGAPVVNAPPARSIREWRTTPSATPGPCPTASPIVNASAAPAGNPPAKPAASAAAPTKAITISLTSALRRGNLVVLLDDVPIFNEKFEKRLLAISQTTTWDPLKVTPGTHRLSARVHGTKKTYFSKSYDLQLTSPKAVVLRFVMQGDKLVVDLAS